MTRTRYPHGYPVPPDRLPDLVFVVLLFAVLAVIIWTLI
jgi:hypothetical protein